MCTMWTSWPYEKGMYKSNSAYKLIRPAGPTRMDTSKIHVGLDIAFTKLTRAANVPAAAEELARWRRALEQAKVNTSNAQERQVTYANKKRRDIEYKVGDM